MSLASIIHSVAGVFEPKAPGDKPSTAGEAAHATWGGLAIWALAAFAVAAVYLTMHSLVTESTLGILLHAFYAWTALHALQVVCSTAIKIYEIKQAYADGSADANDVAVLNGRTVIQSTPAVVAYPAAGAPAAKP